MKKLFLLVLLFVFTNAHSNWTFVSTVSPGTNAGSISVVNQDLIWFCGTAAGGAASVYKSTNGGLTWLLRNGGLPASDLYGLSALDTSNCWVGTVTGSIYRTSNGGINWTLQLSVAGSFSNGVKMFNANYGIYDGDPTGNGQPYQLRYTTNGGTNWILSPGAPIATNEFGVVNAWDWTDTAHVWIGSANTVTTATTAKVYRTVLGFGGGGWSGATLPGTATGVGLYYQAIAFVNNTNGMAGSNAGNIRRSIDGGASWTAATLPPNIGSFSAINMNGLKDGSGIIRASLNAAVDTNYVFKTSDLGNTWILEPIPAQGTLNGLQHMQFLSSTLGYAGGGAGTFFKYTNITVNIKVIIEGLYDDNSDQLRLTDTVRAYLHNSTTPFAVVDSAIALVDSVNFTGKFVFENAPSGTYYIHMNYRNAIETWSKTPQVLSIGRSSTFNYDFTTAATQAFGDNMIQVNTVPPRFGIYSGDVNQDGVVDITDLGLIDNDAFNFVSGYVKTDLNGDFIVDIADAAIADNNAFAFISKIIP